MRFICIYRATDEILSGEPAGEILRKTHFGFDHRETGRGSGKLIIFLSS